MNPNPAVGVYESRSREEFLFQMHLQKSMCMLSPNYRRKGHVLQAGKGRIELCGESAFQNCALIKLCGMFLI